MNKKFLSAIITTCLVVLILPTESLAANRYTPTCELRLDRTEVYKGFPVMLMWSVRNAESATLTGEGNLRYRAGRKVITPTSSTNFTLTAKGRFEDVTCKASIVVKTLTPSCEIFYMTDSADVGDIIKLRYITKDATSARLSGKKNGAVLIGRGEREVMVKRNMRHSLRVRNENGSFTCRTDRLTIRGQ
jgi:hypothetical protein